MSQVVLTTEELKELHRATRLFIACHATFHGVHGAMFCCPAVSQNILWLAVDNGEKIQVKPVAAW